MALRAGVIGVGGIGKQHARIYNQLDETKLVAIADAESGRAKAIAKQSKARAYDDHLQMLEREKLDLISVAVPTESHRSVAEDAIRHGVHVLVEKPIAPSIEDGSAIVKLASEYGIKLCVGHVERFNPAVMELRSQLEDERLGTLFKVHARRLGPFPNNIHSVDVATDLASHDLDIIGWLLDSSVERLYAEASRHLHPTHEDTVSGLMRYTNGAIGLIEVSWLTPSKIRELTITGERGMFSVNYLTQDLHFYENRNTGVDWEALSVLKGVGEGNVVKMHIETREPLREELVAFAKSIRDDLPPPVSGTEGLAAVSLAQDLIRSARTGETIFPKRILEY